MLLLLCMMLRQHANQSRATTNRNDILRHFRIFLEMPANPHGQRARRPQRISCYLQKAFNPANSLVKILCVCQSSAIKDIFHVVLHQLISWLMPSSQANIMRMPMMYDGEDQRPHLSSVPNYLSSMSLS